MAIRPDLSVYVKEIFYHDTEIQDFDNHGVIVTIRHAISGGMYFLLMEEPSHGLQRNKN